MQVFYVLILDFSILFVMKLQGKVEMSDFKKKTPTLTICISILIITFGAIYCILNDNTGTFASILAVSIGVFS